MNFTLCRSEIDNDDELISKLLHEIDKLPNCNPPSNAGKGLDEVCERQQRRKIASIKEATKKALWFLDSFNVDIMSIVIRNRKNKDVKETTKSISR